MAGPYPMASYDPPNCPNCNVALRSLGQLPIRVGGTTPGWHLFLGELADLGEKIKPLDLYRCEKCGRLEFYDHDFSLPER
jgi:hypothetical protein